MRGAGAVLHLFGAVGREVTITSDNKTTAQKAAAKKRPQTWKKGQSGNPKGAPKRGESWRELISSIGNMTGDEVANMAGYMAKEFKRLPSGVTLKQIVIMRTYAQMINEPSPGLLGVIMDRDEGKVKESIDMTISEKVYEVDIEDGGHDQDQDQAESLQ